jgi:DNA replication licensing factor MCM4
LIATNKRPHDFLAKYISYARKYCQPTISDGASDTLIQEYQKMRSLGNSKKTITATPRQLESMIRIAESVTKMRLASVVEVRDVEEAVRLIKAAIQQSATDPKTGEIDMDILTTGVSTASASRIKKICDFIKSVEVSFCYVTNNVLD